MTARALSRLLSPRAAMLFPLPRDRGVVRRTERSRLVTDLSTVSQSRIRVQPTLPMVESDASRWMAALARMGLPSIRRSLPTPCSRRRVLSNNIMSSWLVAVSVRRNWQLSSTVISARRRSMLLKSCCAADRFLHPHSLHLSQGKMLFFKQRGKVEARLVRSESFTDGGSRRRAFLYPLRGSSQGDISLAGTWGLSKRQS